MSEMILMAHRLTPSGDKYQKSLSIRIIFTPKRSILDIYGGGYFMALLTPQNRSKRTQVTIRLPEHLLSEISDYCRWTRYR